MARQLRHLDVDVRGAVGGRGGGVLQQGEEEPAGAGEAREGVEGRFEVGNGLDGDCHFGLCL